MKRGILSSVSRGMLAAGCVVIAGISLVACSKSNDYSNSGTQNAAGLMAFNLTDKAGIGISLSGRNLVSSAMGYNAYTGGYLTVNSGTSTFRSFDATGNATLAETTDSMATSKYYTLVVAGKGGTYRNILVRDNYDNLSGASGKAYIRFVNAVADSAAPAISIAAGGQVISSDAAARFTKVSEFVAVNTGDVVVTASNGSTIQVNRTIPVKAPEVYTVLLKGIPGAADTTYKVSFSYVVNGSLASGARTAGTNSARVQ